MTDSRLSPSAVRARYSPLHDQFANVDEVFDELRALVASGDFTLGRVVAEFEEQFAAETGRRHAIGVGSGTDALKLPLRALGVGHGDEVVTSANTFFATVGAIAEVGAKPIFVDCTDNFGLDPNRLEAAITPRTKAIMPVQLAGDVCAMDEIRTIAERHGIPIVEDGCQSLLAERDGLQVGSWGVATGFSMHPLKIINVWGDAGIVVTDDDKLAERLRLLRNHGLRNRDEMAILGYNSRLDSVQAVVGKWILRQARQICIDRAANAAFYDAAFRDLPQVRLPPRDPRNAQVYLLYMLFAERRDALMQWCLDHGVEAKIHYPIPLYRQEALRFLDHRAGDFPVTDRHAATLISFPVDQHMNRDMQDHVIATVRDFYRNAP